MVKSTLPAGAHWRAPCTGHDDSNKDSPPSRSFCVQPLFVCLLRSGEAMEAALRECCQGIKIGKILVHRCATGIA